MTEQTEQPAATAARKTTIRELGSTLPIGMVNAAGKAARDFATRPWRMKEERELGRLRATIQDATLPHYVSMILATMCTHIGATEMEKLKDITARKLIIGEMYMADVFYAYIWLRIQAMGPDLALKLKCPFCKHEFQFNGDLYTTEVYVPSDTAKGLEYEYKFTKPLVFRNKTVSGFRMGPPRWRCIEEMDVAPGDLGTPKQVSIRGSVVGFIGEKDEIILAPDEVDELPKLDVERLVEAVNDHMLGPVMSIEAKCTKDRCGKTWLAPIDWGYDRFFSASSI